MNLFLFTIGSVQSFIEQARKTQDLFAGSQLLSDITQSVYDFIKTNDSNTEIIFPNIDTLTNRKNPSIPNRFLCLTNYIPQKVDRVDPIKEKVYSKLKEYFKKSIYENDTIAINPKKNLEEEKSILSQLENALPIFWVSIPIEDINANYKDKFDEIERLLGGIKNVREFSQYQYIEGFQGELGRKCSVCGERNVIFYKHTKKNFKLKGDSNWLNETDNKLIESYNNNLHAVTDDPRFNDNEGLCAICYLKRCYHSKGNVAFPSTAEIAGLNAISKLNNEAFAEYQKLFRPNFDPNEYQSFNYQFIYKENLTESFIKKSGYHIQGSINEVVKSWNKLFKDKEPYKYYALFRYDVDEMGTWLSGSKAEITEGEKLKEFQKELSKLLLEFSHKQKDEQLMLENKKGKVVYSGGDEFLAFLTLENLFTNVEDLHNTFQKEVSQKLKEKYQSITESVNITASIIIAHYKTPLSEVLGWSKKVISKAKANGKDQFGIAVLKHSGEIVESYYRWDSTPLQLIQSIFLKISNENKPGYFSSSFIKKFYSDAVSQLDSNNEYLEASVYLPKILKRYLKRSFIGNFVQNDFDVMYNYLEGLFSLTEIYNFISTLSIIDFIHRRAKK